MNKEINQICQKINYQDILDKKFYPVWFFTNERINFFLERIEKNREIRKVFSIGVGGDFAFSLLSSQSLNQIDEINICDIRQMASISIDFKIALFKNFRYEEILDLFLGRKFFNKKQVYKKIQKTITPPTRKVFNFIVKNCQDNNFLKCLKKSGLWYRYSFSQIKNKINYLPYLISREKYQLFQEKLEKIEIYCGDFNQNLKLFKNNYFDLIYLSNVLDSKTYCKDPELYLRQVKEKLNQGGLLFIVTQNNPKRIIRLIEENGFYLYEIQPYRFNIISFFFGHYSYSFLLFKNN